MSTAKFYYKDPYAPKPNKPIRLGAVALIIHEDLLLLECRSDSNRWSLIGGGLEMDESIETCLCREVKEETGLTVHNYSFFNIYSDPSRIIKYPDGNVFRIVTIAYKVQVDDYNVMSKSDESIELKFIKLNELKSINIVNTHKHIIEDYIHTLGYHL